MVNPYEGVLGSVKLKLCAGEIRVPESTSAEVTAMRCLRFTAID